MKTKLLTLTIAVALGWFAFAPSGFAAFEILGDDICSVVSEYSCFEAEIERARRGELAQSNSTLVNPRKNLPPIKEKYSTQISLTTDTDGNAHVAAIALVSDDGCDVRVNGTQWLNESGKGHDISTGVRRYGVLLLPGDENRFDIEYSQTFYDPAVLENDLDGLTMVVMPIPIDISVKDSSGKMNDRILVKKGETIEVALHTMFWEHDLPGNDRVEWEIGRIDATGNIPNWWSCAEMGAKVSLKMDYSGIFKIRAKINGEYFYYRRHQDVENHKNISELQKGADDFIGVCESEFNKKVVSLAYSYCLAQSTRFAKALPIDLTTYGGVQPDNNYAGSWKCNIFVCVISFEAGAKIAFLKRGVPFFNEYSSPPTVSEWKDSTFCIDATPDPDWIYLSRFIPEPGLAITSSGHMGVVDYDGYWIHANEKVISKSLKIGTDGYRTKTLRKRK